MSSLGNSPQTSATTSKPAIDFHVLDPEEIRRTMVGVLLKLRQESLMKAVAEGSKMTGEKLDYGNASAWMRAIPGRFGEPKQVALLRYLGIEGAQLSHQRIHCWALPKPETPEAQAVMDMLDFAGGKWTKALRLTTPSEGLRGYAVLTDGATVVIPPSVTLPTQALETWLDRIGINSTSAAQISTCSLTDEQWQALNQGELKPDALWADTARSTEADWQVVIDWAKTHQLTASDILKIAQQHTQSSQ